MDEKKTFKVWTNDEKMEVDVDNIIELEKAMIFMSENSEAKADPELLKAVAFHFPFLINTIRIYQSEMRELKEKLNQIKKVVEK